MVGPGDKAKEQALRMQFETIDARIEMLDRRLVERMEALTKTVEGMAVNIGQLTTQVKQTNQGIEKLSGTTNQSIEKLSSTIDRLGDRIDRLVIAVDGHLEVAKTQSANITQQGTTINALIELVARQSTQVDRLLERLAA